jgi:hypothetical protein
MTFVRKVEDGGIGSSRFSACFFDLIFLRVEVDFRRLGRNREKKDIIKDDFFVLADATQGVINSTR